MVRIEEIIRYGAIPSRVDSSSKVLCRQTGQEGAIKVTHPIIHLITRKPDDFRQIELARKKRKEPDNQSINELFVIFESDNCRDDWIRTSDPLHPMQVRYRAALRPATPFRRAAKIRQKGQIP